MKKWIKKENRKEEESNKIFINSLNKNIKK